MAFVTRDNRADTALVTLHYYLGLVPNDSDVETLATDLVSDILHLLEREGVEPERVMRVAEDHWRAERQGL